MMDGAIVMGVTGAMTRMEYGQMRLSRTLTRMVFIAIFAKGTGRETAYYVTSVVEE